MDKKEKTITTTKLVEFLGIKYDRLAVWMKKNIFMFDDKLPGAGYPRQFSFDDVVIAKVVTDLMRMKGDFKIASEAVALLRKKPRYRDGFYIMVSFITTFYEDSGSFSEKYDVRWGSFGKNEGKETDILYLDIDEEKVRRSLIFVPVPRIMEEVKEFFEELESTKE